MSGDYATAERWCAKVFDLVPTADDNPVAWVMARRVLGIVRSNQGDPDAGGRAVPRVGCRCHRARQSRALATVYLCVALIDAGRLPGRDQHRPRRRRGRTAHRPRPRLRRLLRLARRGSAHRSRPLDRGRGGPRPPTPSPTRFPVGLLRLARATAMLAARRGETDQALDQLAEAHALARRRMAPVRSRRHGGRCPPRARQLGRGG